MRIDENYTFGPKLKAYMKQQGLRGEDVARITGVNKNTVSGWISKRLTPTWRNAHKIALQMGMKPAEFIESLGDIPDHFLTQLQNEMSRMGHGGEFDHIAQMRSMLREAVDKTEPYLERGAEWEKMMMRAEAGTLSKEEKMKIGSLLDHLVQEAKDQYETTLNLLQRSGRTMNALQEMRVLVK